MSTAESAELVANIRLKDEFRKTGSAFVRTIQDMDRRTQKLQSAVGTLGKGLKTGLVNSAKLAAGAVAFLGYNIKQGIDELVQWEDAQLQVTAALKSTHGAARVTAQMTEELATKYADLVLAEDDVILSAEAMILRFPKVRKKAFEPTLKAALDLAQATGQDVPQAAKLMSMAMSDPIGALGRLERYTGKFSDKQKEQIKTLVESGQLFKAQGIILDKVNAKFGGSAQKATEGYRGNMIRLNKAIKGLQQNLAEPLLKPITRIARALSDFATRPEVIQGLRDFGTALADLASEGNIQKASDALSDGFNTIKNLDWTNILAGIKAGGAIAMAGVRLFTSLPGNVQGALLALLAGNKLTGGLVGDVFKGLTSLVWTGLKTITAANVTVIGTSVTGPGIPGTTPSGKTPGGPTDWLTRGLLTLVGAGGASSGGVSTGIDVAKEMGFLGSDGGLGPRFLRGATKTGDLYKGALARIFAETGGVGSRKTGQAEASFLVSLIKPFVRVMGNYGGTQGLGPGFRSGVPTGLRAPRVAFAEESIKALRSGTVEAKDWLAIRDQIKQGNITYGQALKVLRLIDKNTTDTTSAVKNQQYQFTLKPSVTISASATGNAITFAANGQRLIIQ